MLISSFACEELFPPQEERENMFLEGIQSEDLSGKIRSNAGDNKTPGADKENKLNENLRNKYRIPPDYEIAIKRQEC